MSPIAIGNPILTRPLILCSSITASYVLFYTAYDKVDKKIKVSNLADFFSCRRGIDWTLVEANKAISLSGLTIMLISFLPELNHSRKELLFHGMSLLWIHSVYSSYKFYQFSLKKVLSDKAIKQLSIALGTLGQLSLSLGYWGYISFDSLVASSIVLGISHFWTMEVDYKYKLQVRPYAYLPFPLAIYSIYRYFSTK